MKFREQELERFSDDLKAKAKYNASLRKMRYFYIFNCCVVICFLISSILFMNIYFFVIALIIGYPNLYIWYKVKSTSKAFCSNCGGTMQEHKYSNGIEGFEDGLVFICLRCNKKFIDYEPVRESSI